MYQDLRLDAFERRIREEFGFAPFNVVNNAMCHIGDEDTDALNILENAHTAMFEDAVNTPCEEETRYASNSFGPAF